MTVLVVWHLCHLSLKVDLPMWLSGQSSRGPCAVACDAFRSLARPHPPTKYLYYNNFYAHDEQGDNPVQEKEGSVVSSINCDRC